MKVFDLGCDAGHAFEGWFGSEDDYAQQKARGLLECPFCASHEISKRLSAPRLNLRSGGLSDGAPAPVDLEGGAGADAFAAQDAHTSRARPPSPEAAATMALMQKAWLKAVRHGIENTEDVGGAFSEEARKMHYGETEQRNIRGQATPEETQELLEEGIQVMPLPLPESLKGPLQ